VVSVAAVIVAVCSISYTEYINRTADGALTAFSAAALPIVIGQVALYYLFSRAPSVMGAWLIFSVCMSTARIFMSTIVLQEGLSVGWLLAGVSLMIAAALCIKQAH
jgi:hypothetical protein